MDIDAATLPDLVKALALGFVARYALKVALDGRSFLPLSFLSRLLVVFATTQLSKDSGLFTGAFEATQCSVKILVLFYSNTWHCSGIPSRHK